MLESGLGLAQLPAEMVEVVGVEGVCDRCGLFGVASRGFVRVFSALFEPADGGWAAAEGDQARGEEERRSAAGGGGGRGDDYSGGDGGSCRGASGVEGDMLRSRADVVHRAGLISESTREAVGKLIDIAFCPEMKWREYDPTPALRSSSTLRSSCPTPETCRSASPRSSLSEPMRAGRDVEVAGAGAGGGAGANVGGGRQVEQPGRRVGVRGSRVARYRRVAVDAMFAVAAIVRTGAESSFPLDAVRAHFWAHCADKQRQHLLDQRRARSDEGELLDWLRGTNLEEYAGLFNSVGFKVLDDFVGLNAEECLVYFPFLKIGDQRRLLKNIGLLSADAVQAFKLARATSLHFTSLASSSTLSAPERTTSTPTPRLGQGPRVDADNGISHDQRDRSELRSYESVAAGGGRELLGVVVLGGELRSKGALRPVPHPPLHT